MAPRLSALLQQCVIIQLVNKFPVMDLQINRRQYKNLSTDVVLTYFYSVHIVTGC